MKTLITGAGGFVGSHLVNKLIKKKEKVDCLIYDKSKSNLINTDKFNCIYGDITDKKFVEKNLSGYDKIYHLAALLNYSSPTFNQFFKTNVLGTKNIMETALDSGTKKVVMISSRVTISEDSSVRINENHVHNNYFDNAYSLTKHRAEKIVFEYGARGIDVVTIHPTLIYGPGEMHTTGPLIRNYLTKKIRFAGFLNSTFNLVYVKDVVDGLTSAMKKGKPGHKYIFGGCEVKISEFLSTLDKLTGTNKPVITPPDSLIEFLIKNVVPAVKLLGIKIPVSKDQIYAMKYDTLVDTNKAETELDLNVTPLDVGLKETLDWYKKNNYFWFE